MSFSSLFDGNPQVVDIPPGVHVCDAPVTITRGMTIRGAGWSGFASLERGTVVVSSGNDVFRVMTDEPCTFENFQIAFSGTTGTGIYLDAPVGQTNTDSYIRRVKITGGWCSIGMGSASRFNIGDCVLTGAAGVNLWIRNVNFPDGGDSVVSNNVIDGMPADSLVLYQSGGGLKMIGNKLNGPAPAGLRFQFISDGVNSGALNVTGNSIEGCSYGVMCYRGPGETAKFLWMSMAGNEIAGINQAIHIPPDPAGPWLETLAVSGANNLIVIDPSGIGADVRGANSGVISGNAFYGAPTATAIISGAGMAIGSNSKGGGIA